MSFKEVNIKDLDINPFKLIGDNWTLISAGDNNKVNTMTASWGGMGVLWRENVVTVYIRPQRYTKEFVDNNNCFSLSFFDGYKKELGYLGRVSGRDYDKISDVNFNVTYLDGVPTFKEANLVFVVEKMYAEDIKPSSFIDSNIKSHYPNKDYHTMYIGKILKVYKKES